VDVAERHARALCYFVDILPSLALRSGLKRKGRGFLRGLLGGPFGGFLLLAASLAVHFTDHPGGAFAPRLNFCCVQPFELYMSAPRAGSGRVHDRNSHPLAAGPEHFVLQLAPELTPPLVENCFGV